jgi:hypothetical protein
MKVNEAVKFAEILVSNTRQEIVRVFFSLLFLFAREFIDIWMDEEDVIWVKLLEAPKPKKKKVDKAEPEIPA